MWNECSEAATPELDLECNGRRTRWRWHPCRSQSSCSTPGHSILVEQQRCCGTIKQRWLRHGLLCPNLMRRRPNHVPQFSRRLSRARLACPRPQQRPASGCFAIAWDSSVLPPIRFLVYASDSGALRGGIRGRVQTANYKAFVQRTINRSREHTFFKSTKRSA